MEEWKLLAPIRNITVVDMIDMILDAYPDIDCKDPEDCLCFVYHSYSIVTRRKTKEKVFKKNSHYIKRLDDDLYTGRTIQCPNPNGSKSLITRPLTLKDLHLRVYVPKGEEKFKDISCDSNFMLEVMDDIGKNIRDYYSFIPHDTPVHLFMDNAGGHGKIDIKERYVRHLKDKYNVEVVWQVPYSPETNILDLGVWVALQS